jgi:hypothetical protein
MPRSCHKTLPKFAIPVLTSPPLRILARQNHLCAIRPRLTTLVLNQRGPLEIRRWVPYGHRPPPFAAAPTPH